MKQLHSIKKIEKTYNTGEEPVLVACNDHNSYICKYTRYSGSANKLVCYFIPSAWIIDRVILTNKIEELLSYEWVARVKDGFTETFNTALGQ